MSKKNKSGLVVFIIIILAAFTVLLFSYFSKNTSGASVYVTAGKKPSYSTKTYSSKKSKTGKDNIAILYIEGTIQPEGDTYNQNWVLSNIEKLKNDPKNHAIILFINSPGGTVYEADETYLALQSYKSTGKKVYAYMGALAASGGYYISCAAEKIYANRNTLTGSIGVIAGQFIDITDFLENHGIYYETIHAGKNKNMGNYNEPVTDEQLEIMQSIADECYDQFTSIVSTSRHIPYKEVLPLCDGRIYTATQALKNGLIDGVGTWDDFITFVMNENESFENCKQIVFRYERQKGFFENMISSFVGKPKAKAQSGMEVSEGIPAFVWEDLQMKGPLYLYK